MTRDLDTQDASRGDRTRSRAYFREFLPGMVGYGVVLVIVLLFGDLDGRSPWRFAWAVLPVLPLLWVLRAVARHLRRVDEYQRRQLLSQLGIGFAVAMVAAVTAGFLGVAGLDMRFGGWVVFAAGMMGWALGGVGLARSGR